MPHISKKFIIMLVLAPNTLEKFKNLGGKSFYINFFLKYQKVWRRKIFWWTRRGQISTQKQGLSQDGLLPRDYVSIKYHASYSQHITETYTPIFQMYGYPPNALHNYTCYPWYTTMFWASPLVFSSNSVDR